VSTLIEGYQRIKLAPHLARLYSLTEIDLMLAIQRYYEAQQAKQAEAIGKEAATHGGSQS
jgi:hypothetical protein